MGIKLELTSKIIETVINIYKLINFYHIFLLKSMI